MIKQYKMNKENKKNIYQKVFSIKSQVGKLIKDKNNPFFKSKYFDINQLIQQLDGLLQENNLILLQPIINNKVISEIIDIETGEKISSELELQNLNDPQKIGSTITYYRRYTLQSLLGLQADDDDGNKASGLAVNEDKTKQWLSDNDFKIIIERSNIEGVQKGYNYWNKSPRAMKKEFREKLLARMTELKY